MLGLLELLAAATRTTVESQIAEVLTGQGKSWVLLLLGAIFAVTGKGSVART